MKIHLQILWFFVIACTFVSAFLNPYGKVKRYSDGGDPGEPLILTPFIEAGKIEEAQNLSFAKFNGFKDIQSYSGYFTVNKEHNSNLFFWFFPAMVNPDNAPVLLWLQGGPGASSLLGLFTENGPFKPMNKHGLKLRQYSWTRNHNVIYIDNPVGSGYSFTNGGYVKSEQEVGQQLYTALLQFFQLFPKLQNNEFYVSGESYAGKYVPAVAYTIHRSNPSAAQKINLAGLTIGNGLCDPEHQLKYSDYLYQLGLIDLNSKVKVQEMEAQGVKYIQNKQWPEAFKVFDDLLNGDLNNHTSYFKNVTGFENYFNYLSASGDNLTIDNMNKYIQRSDVRAAIHVGNVSFSGESQTVEENLMEDVMQPITNWLSELLANYRVLIYNGQLDIIVAYPLTVNYLQQLQFAGMEDYKTAPRHIWRVGDDVAGYAKHAGNLTEVLVRNAGHMVPTDQPLWAFDLITRFTYRKGFKGMK